jgi:hypothetical protein
VIGSKEIRVAIFEDNPIMMDAYRSILNGSPGYMCPEVLRVVMTGRMILKKVILMWY